MTKVVTFATEFGPIHFEVDELPPAEDSSPDVSGELVAKGPFGLSGAAGAFKEVISETRFENAIGSLKAYAQGIQEIVQGMNARPKEVTVEVGLTLKGEAGFFAIAKAGSEAQMKVKMSWEPSGDS